MRKAGGIIVNAVAALSLLLCVATVVLWVHGYFATDGVSWTRFRYTDPTADDGTIAQDNYLSTMLVSSRGCLSLSRWEMTQDAGDPSEFTETRLFSDPASDLRPKRLSRWRWLGFWADSHVSAPCNYRYGMPVGAFVLATALLPLARFRRRRRLLAGCCENCGYDLRATPD